jgi:hypothetical protein
MIQPKQSLTMPEMTPFHVERRASLVADGHAIVTKTLVEWRESDAYVLLGDPGAGKTESFKIECIACHGLWVEIRDIVDGVVDTKNVGDQIVFIDGLDEVRAGASDKLTPFGAIRMWLKQARSPRFRLSCREADWLGESDRSALERVAPLQHVDVLHLVAFDPSDVRAVLQSRSAEVPDPEAFWLRCEQLNLIPLLGNPLLLDLLIKAVASDGFPENKKDIYEASCRQLAREHSRVHLNVAPPQAGDVDRLLNDAGLLCAVLLLSNRKSVSSRGGNAQNDVNLADLPEKLRLQNPTGALKSKVFSTAAELSTPRHRSIAEFLGAKALAKRITEGLPLGRVLALIQGIDGRPVEPLRGLFAWLVVHVTRDRERLIDLDPLGVVLNGDVSALSKNERVAVLNALGTLAGRDKWFRDNAWVSHPFGALATADMAATLDELLRRPHRDDAHQALIDCVMAALSHGEEMPELGPALELWVEDSRAQFRNRLSALYAWKHNVVAALRPAKSIDWLNQFAAGGLVDLDDRLSEYLLADLYPVHIGPTKVFNYLRPSPIPKRHVSRVSLFWGVELLRNSRPQDFAQLADAWVDSMVLSADLNFGFDTRRLRVQLMSEALKYASDDITNERLFAWLGIALDENGYSLLDDETRPAIASWLEARPDRIKALVNLGFDAILRSGERFFWDAEQRLHGCQRPRDWLYWLLDVAAATANDELAQYCFVLVADLALDPPSAFDVPTMEHVEKWVETHAQKRPAFKQWLEQSWSLSLEDWRGKQHRSKQRYAAERIQERARRKQIFEPHLSALLEGNAHPDVLGRVARAYQKRFSDLSGETPIERVQDLLVSDTSTAQAAIRSVDESLKRSDLPSAKEVLKFDAEGKSHFLRSVALLAAARSFEGDPAATEIWSTDLVQTLIAFYLTDNMGGLPDWYRFLAGQRPTLVAPILVQYAVPKFRTKGEGSVAGLWALSSEPNQRELARLVLPTLLTRIPLRASEASRRELNRSLLGALNLLDDADASALVFSKLSETRLDSLQRIAWLVAALPYRPDATDALAAFVGKNERRAIALGIAFHDQGSLSRTVHRLSSAAVRRLIEVLAPITPRDFGTEGGWVSAMDNREQTVRGLFSVLSADASTAARDELKTLFELDGLAAWKDIAEYSIRAQQSAVREALFKPADPAEIALMIANREPANASDLQALVADHLADIEAELRGKNTFLLSQFWKAQKTKAGSEDVPHEENFCRDVLQPKLEDRLRPLNVHVGREVTAARDKRIDMQPQFMRNGKPVVLPIELKKENHEKLWTAWRDQLQRLYLVDPAAAGFGLYVVLWFGVKPRATPEGVKPQSAKHMQELLVKRIPPSERHQLGVLVLDLSFPKDP